MEKLKQYIGKKIKYECVFNKHNVTGEGILTEVVDYKFITIDHQITIPFVGMGQGIITLSCDDEIIFHNPNMTTDYWGFGPEVNTIARKTFGKPWIRVFEEDMAKIDPCYNDYHVTQDWFIMPSRSDEEVIEYYNKSLQAYIAEGKTVIQDEQHKQEWEQLCKRVVGNRKQIELLNAIFAVMQFLSNYMAPFDEMLRTVQAELQLSDETLNWAVLNAAIYSPRGEELLMFWANNHNRLEAPEDKGPVPGRK